MYTFKPGDWPNIDVKPFAPIDPKGRIVYTRSLSLTPDGKWLIIAGKCMGERFKPGQFDGIWAIDTATRKSQLVADITGLLKKSFKDDDIGPYANHYSGTNAVSRDGWIYIGVRKMPETFYPHGPDVATDLRLMGIRVTKD